METAVENHAAFLWSVADLLRGDYKQSEYGKVILPLTVIRRLDCVLAKTKPEVLERHAVVSGKVDNLDPILETVSGEQFYNVSKLDLPRLLDDPANIADNLRAYIAGFSETARDIIDKFDFDVQMERLDASNLLYPVVSKFCDINLHPEAVSNSEMGWVYEELIRRFSELSNETAGEHFTPRDVIELMVNLLFAEDVDFLSAPGIVKTMLDPAAGTGGMLSTSQQHLARLNSQAQLEVYGQELNAETYAICRSEMMLRGEDASHVVHGNSLSEDGHAGRMFDYLLTHPPFGAEWRSVRKVVEQEHESLGFAGRFGAGTPRISDSSFLFLQHMISKMKPVEQGGSRVAIVFNGSPLFTGAAGSGESEIRRWIIENDWLEAVVALPDQLLYNTGIATYFWILTNRKSPSRRGKVQLIDARDRWAKMRETLGGKRKYLTDEHIADITRIYGTFEDTEHSRIFPNGSFEGQESEVSSWAIEPWMFVVGPEEANYAPLSEYVQTPPARKAEPEDLCLSVESDGNLRTIESHRQPSRSPMSTVESGDLVLVGGRWVVVDDTVFPDGVNQVLTSAPVLRLREDFRDRARILAMWLSSPEASRQSPQRAVQPSRSIRVPRRLMHDEPLALAVSDVLDAQSRADAFLGELLDSPLADGRADPSTLTPEELHGHANRLNALVQLLQPMKDPFRRAEWSYPLQIAELARQYRLASESERRFEAAIRLGDALARHVGLLAGAALRNHERGVTDDVLQHFRGGISSGAWLRLVQDATSRGASDVLPELSEVSFKKHGAGALLQQVVEMRNASAHAHGLTSRYEIEEGLERMESLLTAALEELSWLAGLQTVIIRRVEYRHGTHQVYAEILHGSHPSWEPVTFTTAEPTEPDRVIAYNDESRVDLSPFMNVRSCPTCRRDETYILERLNGGRFIARSLRNHDIELDWTDSTDA